MTHPGSLLIWALSSLRTLEGAESNGDARCPRRLPQSLLASRCRRLRLLPGVHQAQQRLPAEQNSPEDTERVRVHRPCAWEALHGAGQHLER